MKHNLMRCHHPDLASVWINSRQRAFVSCGLGAPLLLRSGRYSVAPHAHSYDLTLTVLRGQVTHRVFSLEPGELRLSQLMSSLEYTSGLASKGSPSFVVAGRPQRLYYEDTVMLPTDSTYLTNDQIHTVAWSPGSVWLVEERPKSNEAPSVNAWSPEPDVEHYGDLYQRMHDDTAQDLIYQVNYLKELHNV